MNDVIDMSIKSSSDLSSESRVAMLNADQQHIYDNMKSHLLHQQQHEEMSLRGRETTTNVCQWHWKDINRNFPTGWRLVGNNFYNKF